MRPTLAGMRKCSRSTKSPEFPRLPRGSRGQSRMLLAPPNRKRAIRPAPRRARCCFCAASHRTECSTASCGGSPSPLADERLCHRGRGHEDRGDADAARGRRVGWSSKALSSRATLTYLDQASTKLAAVADPRVEPWQAELHHYRPLIERIIWQTERRVFFGETVIETGNPADSERFLLMPERHIAFYGEAPRQGAADGGFASRENLSQVKAHGVHRRGLPQEGRPAHRRHGPLDLSEVADRVDRADRGENERRRDHEPGVGKAQSDDCGDPAHHSGTGAVFALKPIRYGRPVSRLIG